MYPGQQPISRQYEDFEYLHHVLTTQCDTEGVIVPPLPPRPIVDPLAAENRSKRQLGGASRHIRGDDYLSDVRNLERYLQVGELIQ